LQTRSTNRSTSQPIHPSRRPGLGSREKVAEFLSKSGVVYEMREFDESTRSSALAAQVLGCTVPEIAKSVVFVGEATAVAVLSGDRRVAISKMQDYIGLGARVAKPDEVRERTGFPIGGVPPFPHAGGILVLPDRSLTRFSHVWAAAGTPSSVFRMRTADLIGLVGRGPNDLSE
jgi:prolyl-tRNA editing enzyme YbaK/EbsC (Cys-tRNA(Pro) deacylase)